MPDETNTPGIQPTGQSATPDQASASGANQSFFEYDWEDGKKDSFKSPDELKAFFRGGVLRHQDYTKKTQALADERRKIEARNKELEVLANNLTSKKSEIDKYDKFLTSRPDIRDRLAREMKQMSSGDLMDQAKGLVDERSKQLEEKLSEIEKWKSQQELERKREAIFNHMGTQYQDFDKEAIVKMINGLQEVPDEDNLYSLVDLLYWANKGKATPASVEKRVVENLQKKGAMRPLVGSGARVPAPSGNSPKGFREAAEAVKRKLGA